MQKRKSVLDGGCWAPLVVAAMLVACGDGTTAAVVDVADNAEPDPDGSEPDTSSNPDTVGPETIVAEPAFVQVLLDENASMSFGLSKVFEVEVPTDVVSMTVSVIGDDATFYGLADWTGPGGNALVTKGWVNTDEGQGGLCLSCKNRIALSGGAFATIAPNNPAAEVTAGCHTFSLFGYEPPKVVQGQGRCGDGICHQVDQFQCTRDCRTKTATGPVRVLVHAKMAAGGLPATGVLDLNLHFTGAQGLSAASAQTDAGFRATIESVRSIFSQVRLDLGTITYRDIDSGYRTIESLDGEGSDLQAMFSESDGNPNALNLFFVDELSAAAFGGFGVILGIAGGIPGPPLVQGSSRSGVAIAIKPIAGAPAGIDTTMAHEVGHFLGLFHTSEQAFFGPQVHDPLPDTPDNDASYLMFNTGAGNKLSEWQGRVMRSNPWVRHPAPQ